MSNYESDCGHEPKVLAQQGKMKVYEQTMCVECDRVVCGDCYGDYDYGTDTGVRMICKDCLGGNDA